MTPVASEIGQGGIDPTIQDDAKKEGFNVYPLAIVAPQLDLTSILQLFFISQYMSLLWPCSKNLLIFMLKKRIFALVSADFWVSHGSFSFQK